MCTPSCAAHGHLLRARREGQRGVLRQRAKDGRCTPRRLVLRPAHQQAFHAEDAPLKLADLQDFITCYHPENRHERVKAPTVSSYVPYEEMMARDKASLDIFWLKDDSLDRWTTCRRRMCCSRKSSSTWRLFPGNHAPPDKKTNPSSGWSFFCLLARVRGEARGLR
jgi:hypothetical protein